MCRRDGYFVIVARCCSLCSLSPHWCGQGSSFHDINISLCSLRGRRHIQVTRSAVSRSPSTHPPPLHPLLTSTAFHSKHCYYQIRSKRHI